MVITIWKLFSPPRPCGPLCRAVEDEVASMRHRDQIDAMMRDIPETKKARR